MFGILQDERRLKIPGTVKAARQPEMSLQVSACLLKQVENTVGLRRHKRLLYHWELLSRAIKKREPYAARARILLQGAWEKEVRRIYPQPGNGRKLLGILSGGLE